MLLDTCTLLWWLGEPEKLSQTASTTITSSSILYISSVTAYEITLKYSLGKLPLKDAPERVLQTAVSKPDMVALNLSIDHALLAGSLPLAHKDPFDRMLAAQALHEHIPIISPDPAFTRLGCEVVW
jgi:PIN domain nuclease of toxin-antitoxin system